MQRHHTGCHLYPFIQRDLNLQDERKWAAGRNQKFTLPDEWISNSAKTGDSVPSSDFNSFEPGSYGQSQLTLKWIARQNSDARGLHGILQPAPILQWGFSKYWRNVGPPAKSNTRKPPQMIMRPCGSQGRGPSSPGERQQNIFYKPQWLSI